MSNLPNLQPDLLHGVVPISKAASALAALITQAKDTKRPIAITQKGKPTAILLSVELFDAVRAAVEAEETPTDAA